ncbi:8133_t:CDS:2, partial [Funneliformis caledonium]
DSELANVFHPVRLPVEQHLTCDSELANILQPERLPVEQQEQEHHGTKMGPATRLADFAKEYTEKKIEGLYL